MVWLLWWHKPMDVQRPIFIDTAGLGPPFVSPRLSRHPAFMDVVIGLFLGKFPDYDPDSSTSVPSFWSTNEPEKTPVDAQTNEPDGTKSDYTSIGAQAVIGVVFGLIHCSIAIVVLAVISTLSYMAMNWFRLPREHVGWQVFDPAFVVAFALYIAARLFLIGLAFSTLRDLPTDAFRLIKWTTHIIHIS
ncbi:hypothetical protein C8R45DRAFT_1111440 [Mycena sanguinolenta]|nr:hypothetical protein C8R45DRAFT_1111440 [Mycena sanguinolenta]